jgi:hypothetical protein
MNDRLNGVATARGLKDYNLTSHATNKKPRVKVILIQANNADAASFEHLG